MAQCLICRHRLTLGHQLTVCLSSARAAVVLDSPAGLSSDVWLAVLPRVAHLTRTCVFDRAGLGFSDR